MHFATAYQRVCRGGVCWHVPTRLQGLGDTIDTNDPCATNPNDPVCIEFYGGRTAAEQAAVSSTAGGNLCATDEQCATGYTCNVVSGVCEQMQSSAPGSIASWWKGSMLNPATWGSGASPTGTMHAGSASSAAAAVGMGKVPWGFMLVVALVGGAAYGGIRWYEKKRKR